MNSFSHVIYCCIAMTNYTNTYAYACMRNHNDDTKTSDTVLRKIYLSLYLKGLCVRGSWRPNRTATYWPPLLWPSVFLSHSPGLLNWGPGSPALCWVQFSLQHHFSISSDTQTLWISCALSYIISSTPTQSLPITGHRNMHFCHFWNGMFDCHRAEITVMQFTGHSLPVHQFVTVPWDFNPVPYYQSSSPTPMEYATSAVFGMACLAGSEVNILQNLWFTIVTYSYISF